MSTSPTVSTKDSKRRTSITYVNNNATMIKSGSSSALTSSSDPGTMYRDKTLSDYTINSHKNNNNTTPANNVYKHRENDIHHKKNYFRQTNPGGNEEFDMVRNLYNKITSITDDLRILFGSLAVYCRVIPLYVLDRTTLCQDGETSLQKLSAFLLMYGVRKRNWKLDGRDVYVICLDDGNPDEEYKRDMVENNQVKSSSIGKGTFATPNLGTKYPEDLYYCIFTRGRSRGNYTESVDNEQKGEQQQKTGSTVNPNSEYALRRNVRFVARLYAMEDWDNEDNDEYLLLSLPGKEPDDNRELIRNVQAFVLTFTSKYADVMYSTRFEIIPVTPF